MDTNTRQKRIKRDSPPEDYFESEDLRMGQAVYNGDIKTIELLIKNEHFNINKRGNKLPTTDAENPVRYTYLGYAVRIGEVKAAEKLLELGANPGLINHEGDGGGGYLSNINLACNIKNKKMIRLLVRYKENLNPTLCGSPIDDLITGDVDKDMIDLLLANGADINHQEYIGGGTAIFTALGLGKFEYVHYFLDKGADPLALDSHGNSLASLVQDEINEGRLSDYGLKEYNKVKERLINEFHIKFPVENGFAKGRAMAIARYENLSQADKDFLGQDEVERIKEWKEGLEHYKETDQQPKP